MKKKALYGLIIFVFLLSITYVSIGWTIGKGVKSVCAEAAAEFAGDKVGALIAYVNSESHSFKEKNRAIWALGQLGDVRALSLLEQLYTGQSCEHDKYLCQYELKKAIRLCKGGLNITAWIWR